MENDYMLIKRDKIAYRVRLCSQDGVGCLLEFGDKTLKMEDYDERMWVYHLYADGKLGWITLWLNKRYHNSLSEEEIDMAVDSFKLKHPMIGVPEFNYHHIPIYADPENGLTLHALGHVVAISLQDECELLDKIAAEPFREVVPKNLKEWFDRYCRNSEYDFLKSGKKEVAESLYKDFLMQHGIDSSQFPLLSAVKAQEDADFRARIADKRAKDAEKSAFGRLLVGLLGFGVLAAMVGILDLDGVGVVGFFLIFLIGSTLAVVCFDMAGWTNGNNENR